MNRAGDTRPRILHVITSFGRGGAETMLAQLLVASRDGPFQQGLIVLRDQASLLPALHAEGIPGHSLEMPGGGLPGPLRLRRFAALVREFQPDLLQGWLYHGNLAALAAARLCPGRPPVLFNLRNLLHDIRREPSFTRLAIRLGGRCSRRVAVIVHNARLSVEHHARVGYPAARALVIPNGVDCTRFRPDPEAYRAVRAELGLAPGTLLVGRICRYHPVKDHAGFLAAARRVLAAGHDVRFLLAGIGITPDNPALAAELGRCAEPGRFYLLGERRDIPRLTAALDIAVSSSLSEAFPNTVAEAAACGVPCVVTDVGESAEIIGPGGRVVAPHDPPALAAALAQLLDLGEARREPGRLARARVLERFSLETAVDRYRALYRRVLAGEPLPLVDTSGSGQAR